MMKKVMKCLVVAAAVLSMSMTAFAVESPTDGYIVSGVVEGASVDANGTWVDLIVEEVDPTLLAEIEYINETAELVEVLGSAYSEGMEVVEIREVYIVGDEELIEWPVTIVFDVAGVTANTEVAVLHYVNGAWEVIDAIAGAGTITATFDSLSPVAFIIGETVDTDSSDTTTDTTTSPETGEVNMVAIAAMVGCVAMASAIVLRKRAVR